MSFLPAKQDGVDNSGKVYWKHIVILGNLLTHDDTISTNTDVITHAKKNLSSNDKQETANKPL